MKIKEVGQLTGNGIEMESVSRSAVRSLKEAGHMPLLEEGREGCGRVKLCRILADFYSRS